MFGSHSILAGVVCIVVMAVMLLSTTVQATVTVETVTIGNVGNVGEWAGETYGGHGPDRICGSVNYVYDIGKYEITAEQYCEFLQAVAGIDTYDLYKSYMWSDTYGCKIERYAGNGTSSNPYQYRVAADQADRPVNYVGWGDIARFANWLHNGQPTGVQDNSTTEDGSYVLNGATDDATLLAITRKSGATWVIPTEDEWYKSAYHKNDGATGNYFDYPTSDDNLPSNDLGVPDDPGNSATFYNQDFTIGSPYWRTQVGDHENSGSPYGTFDQGGNVWEWNESSIVITTEGITKQCRGLRGDSFGNLGGSGLYMHASYRDGDIPTYDSQVIGFRVARVPEPSVFTLLSICTIALLSWRSRR